MNLWNLNVIDQHRGPFQEKAFSQPIGMLAATAFSALSYLFTLWNVGKYTEPFKTQHGYHILLVEERAQ